jgi:methyltransferase (TIGR00027 family)
MRDGIPSRTAQHNALFRALEERLPQPLFQDPWARRFLRGRYRVAAALPARWVARAIDWRWPGPRAAVAVRTRYIDDAVQALLVEGLDQLVILGAGLDARAQRMTGLAGIALFEVDHPATQELKRRLLGPKARQAIYVPVDFTRDSLEPALTSAGLRPGQRTLFIWEGVTNYLDAASVDATLRFIAHWGSHVLFTYIDRAILERAEGFEGAAESIRLVDKLGEPFTFGLDPSRIATYLDERGVELVEDLPLSSAARLYYAAHGPRVSTYYHVVAGRCRG